MRIGIFGGGPQAWPSLNKTHAAYVRALGLNHSVVALADEESGWSDIDVVLAFAGDAGWRLARRAERPPIVFVLHGGAVLNVMQIGERLPTLQPGDRFIGNCSADETVLDALAGADPPPTHAVPLPVDAPGRTREMRDAARTELGIADDEGVIAIVSRLVPQKNVHHALRSAAAAMELNPRRRWRIVVVGSFWPDYRILRTPDLVYHDWLRAEVVRLGIEDRLMLFAAGLSASELATVYAAADVALSLTHSIDENFGYFAIEAMGSGVPVIGTAYGGQRDSIVGGTSGWPLATWYTPTGIRSAFGDAAQLLAGMSRSAIDAMGIRAQAFVEAHHGEQSFANRLEAICDAAIRERAGGPRAPSAAEISTASDKGDDDDAAALRFEHDALDDYAFAIRRYVSDAAPRVDEGDRLVPFAPLVLVDGRLVAADPVWPVRYRASAAEVAVLASTSRDGRVHVSGATRAAAQHLVTTGLLVPERLSC